MNRTLLTKIAYAIILLFISITLFGVITINNNNNMVYAETGEELAGSATIDGLSCSVNPSKSLAQDDMERVISTRTKVSNISYTIDSSVSWFYGCSNHSQGLLNIHITRRKGGPLVDGTCSLVAIMSIIDELADYGRFTLQQFDAIDAICELYDISTITYGNNYIESYGETGTPTNTLAGIWSNYYATKGISVSCSTQYYTGNVNESLAESLQKLSVLTITAYSRYLNDGNYEVHPKSHSLVYNGRYCYKTSYKSKPWYAPWGITVNKDFNMYAVTTGWSSNSTIGIGQAQSLIVFNDDAKIHFTSIDGGWE